MDDARLLDAGVNFLPWRGAAADMGLVGFRTLVLGESHYFEPNWKDRAQYTRQVVGHWLKGSEHYEPESQAPYFLKLAALLGYDNVDEAFRRIYFYNFVSRAMPTRTVRPTRRDFKDSLPPLSAVLDEVRPQVVIVTGYAGWDHLPGDGREGWMRRWQSEDVLCPAGTGRRPQVWTCPHAGGATAVTYVGHPAWRKFGAPNRWRLWLSSSLAQAHCVATQVSTGSGVREIAQG